MYSLVPCATVQVEGVTHRLYAGNIIGRGDVHLVIPHPDVSEAHAMCSLREDSLVLLRLRGALLHDGEDRDAVVLEAGVSVGLGEEVRLDIVAVHLPARVLALTDGDATIPLRARYSRYRLEPLGAEIDGPLEVWPRGAELWAACGGEVRRLEEGMSLGSVRVVTVPADRVATTPTFRRGPLVDFTTHPVTVHTDQPHTFNALTTRLLSALAGSTDPVHWRKLAQRMWPGEDPEERRKDFENAWSRAAKELRAAHAPGLVKRTGRGYYWLDREGYQIRI